MMGSEEDVLPFFEALIQTTDAPIPWTIPTQTEPVLISTQRVIRLSYEDHIIDPSIQIVFITQGMKNPTDLVKACLAYKKHVVYTGILGRGREKLYKTAQENQNILIENWPWSLLPSLSIVKDIIHKGKLGSLIRLDASVGFLSTDLMGRERSVCISDLCFLASLLYPMFISVQLLPPPDHVCGFIIFDQNSKMSRVLGYNISLQHPKGILSSISSSLQGRGKQEVCLFGTKHRLSMETPFFGDTTIRLYDGKKNRGFIKPSYTTPEKYLIQEVDDHFRGKKELIPQWDLKKGEEFKELLIRIEKSCSKIPFSRV
ncbi:MAG: hypothetical protein OXB93_03895 [Cytophagales bacterium]|nr:hypothetical protein [Cytophagales bacterium]